MLSHILEYAAFSASLFSVWLYGRKGLSGPVAGALTALLFIAFGFVSHIYAASFANIVFFTLHVKNGVRIMSQDEGRRARKIGEAVNLLVTTSHQASTDAGWWRDENRRVLIKQPDGTWEEIELHQDPYVIGTKLMLMTSEISEAMEGHRKGLMDDKLPHRKMIEVELGDAMIRIADLAGALGLDLGGAIAEKMAFNRIRPDHKPEHRAAAGGKAY